jgi:uncharacterized protein YegL
MRNNLSELVLVVDRSGSMNSCRVDAEGGINAFIKDQRGQPGEATLTLVQFDDKYEFVHKGTPIMEVGDYKLIPRGWTALLDAVGKAVNETGERLAALPESERPGCVIVVIVTDGQENMSKEFTRQQVRDMITHQQEKYNWKFTFIGTDASTFDDAANIGINLDQTVRYDPAKSGKTYHVMSNAVSQVRCASMNGQLQDLSYSDDQRNEVL